MGNNVTSPSHYSGDGIECIDVIEAALGPYGFRAFCLGNVLKYSWRHKQKNGAEDLAKANVYRAWALAGTASKREPTEPDEIVETLAHAVEAPMPPYAEIMLERAFADDETPGSLKAGEAQA